MLWGKKLYTLLALLIITVMRKTQKVYVSVKAVMRKKMCSGLPTILWNIITKYLCRFFCL